MEITIDREICSGHGRCYVLAPEVFDADDEGYPVLVAEQPLPVELEGPATTAQQNCPESAIHVSAGGER